VSTTATTTSGSPDAANAAKLVSLDFAVVGSTDVGICGVEAAGTDAERRSLDCVRRGTVETQTTSRMGATGATGGIEALTLYACPEAGADCVSAGTDHCLGFAWRLPPGVENAQTDSVAFDLGFYAEQCGSAGGDR
jgi:hypothetical protein